MAERHKRREDEPEQFSAQWLRDKLLTQELGESFIKVIGWALDLNNKVTPATRLRAAELFAMYALGKPEQTITIQSNKTDLDRTIAEAEAAFVQDAAKPRLAG